MRRPHNRTFKCAVDELRTAAGELRRAQAGASDRYDPALRSAHARYARVRDKVVMASAKARAEARQLRLKFASVVFLCAVALALAAVVGALPFPLAWLEHADFVAAITGLALAGVVALILHGSPGKMRDALLLFGLRTVSGLAHWIGLSRKSESRNSGDS